jgi:WD40 repeat protein
MQKVTSIQYDPASQQVYTGSADGTVRAWSTVTGQVRVNALGHTCPGSQQQRGHQGFVGVGFLAPGSLGWRSSRSPAIAAL